MQGVKKWRETYRARIRSKDARQLQKVKQQRLGQALEDGSAVEVLAVLVAFVGVREQAADALVLELRQLLVQAVRGAEDAPGARVGLGRRLQVAQLLR